MDSSFKLLIRLSSPPQRARIEPNFVHANRSRSRFPTLRGFLLPIEFSAGQLCRAAVGVSGVFECLRFNKMVDWQSVIAGENLAERPAYELDVRRRRVQLYGYYFPVFFQN